MYQYIIKPLVYWFNIEHLYRLSIVVLRSLSKLPFVKPILRSLYRVEHPSLEREVFGLHFANPIGMAAGFDTNGEIFESLEAVGFGFVEIGAITPESQAGNPRPRLFHLKRDRAILNRRGHPNRGWSYVIKRLRRRNKRGVVGCNITCANNIPISAEGREYLKSFRNLYQYADYFTVNLNYDHLLKSEEMSLGESITAVLEPLFDFRRGQSDYRPILVKVSPDLSDEMLDVVSDVLIETPLDGVVAVSGTKEREGLATSSEQLADIGSGRISGAPLRERALEVVRHIYNRTDGAYPIIGVGGVMSGEDARAMLDAGASLVQIYSGFIYGGLSSVGKICRSLIK